MPHLIALRHAPTDWSAQHRLQGRADPPLSEAGVTLAKAWRLPPAYAPADRLVWTSPLRRARQTADHMGLAPYRVSPALIEADWGAWEGHSLAALRARDPDGMAAQEARGLDFAAPGGEPPRAVIARLRPFLAGLDRPAIAICHKGVLRCLLALACGWDMTGKPPVKIVEGAAIGFQLSQDGGLAVAEARISLTGPA